MSFKLATASGLPLSIHCCGYRSDAKPDALAAMRRLAAARIRGNDHVSSGNGW